MKENNSDTFLHQEQEIEFRSLILTLLNSKGLIIGLTLVFTALVAIYNFTITPTYKATATVILGTYEPPQLSCRDEMWFKGACTRQNHAKKSIFTPRELIIELNMEVLQNIENSVSLTAKNGHSITITSLATSNEIAKNSISKIMSYVQERHSVEFGNIKNSRAAKIKSFNEDIRIIEEHELKPLNTKSTQELKIISQKIDYVNSKQLPELDKQIDILENKELPELIDRLNKFNEILYKAVDAQVLEELDLIEIRATFINNNQLPELIKKINLYSQYLAANEELLTQSEDNLQNLENSSTTLASLRLTKIQDLKKLIFYNNEKIIDLNSLKSKLLLELSELTQAKKLLENYEDIGLLDNAPTFPSTRLATIPYFENIIYEYKINLLALEDKILSIKSSKLPALKEKRESLRLKIEELENEKFFFVNYTLPEYELLKNLNYTKISNIKLQQNEYERLLNNHYYLNASTLGGIVTKDNPFKPNIVRNIIIAFLTSFMLSIFLVLVINLSKTSNNKKTA